MPTKTLPVFSGLGSDVVLKHEYEQTNAHGPYRKLLLEACHRIFLHELSLISPSFPLDVDLACFQEPSSLLQLSSDNQYRRHPALQHATLCLNQLLHYLSDWGEPSQDDVSIEATAGFCAGILPAIAVATSTAPANIWNFLSCSEQVFRLAVLLGIASDRARRCIKAMRPRHCWSVVVSGLPVLQMENLIDNHDDSDKSCQDSLESGRLWLSAVISLTCVTVSGEGTSLDRFVHNTLQEENCVVKRTNVFSPYHNGDILSQQKDWILRQYRNRALSFPEKKDLRVPVIRTTDGSLIYGSKGKTDGTELLEEVLQMVMMTRTDWVAVQDRFVSLGSAQTDKLVCCCYGPGSSGLLLNPWRVHLNIQDNYASRVEEESKIEDQDIAVVGVGIDLPGSGMDLDLLWQNLMDRTSACTEIPKDRFAFSDYHASNKEMLNSKRTLHTKYGNFLPDSPFTFDNELFGISPREAMSMDPQQRLLLQTTHRALEHAGYTPDASPSFCRQTFGCFVGNATLDYLDHLRDEIDVYYSTGTLRAFLSGRISYAFKFSGPCMTVDTACSSSLVAIYHAVESLRNGKCRAAVAGGVNIMSSPDMYIGLDKSRFLSPTGQCKSFQADADGYCRGEGCAIFVLKKLTDAVKENDRILGVIKAVEVNQSGEAASITQPLAEAQERLFRQLVSNARIQPAEVTVVEAHGTGTKAGDPCEMRSIRNVFRDEGSGSKRRRSRNENPLFVTSIKANIGHLEAASGGASLVKLLLMLKHRSIPPQAINGTLLPAIAQLSNEGIWISDKFLDWNTVGSFKRTAVLNNFGAAGSNAALLLQEWNETRETQADDKTTYVFACSARTPELLERVRNDTVSYIKTHHGTLSLADICYTATARRSLGRHRLALTTTSIEELLEKLPEAPVHHRESLSPNIVFLFSGQGSQYTRMGHELFRSYSIFRETVLRCHNMLVSWGFSGCLEYITSSDTASETTKQDANTMRAAQTSLFVLEIGIVKLLKQFKLQPTAVSGHSLGEFAALVTAGVLDLEAGLWIVAHRARLISSIVPSSNASAMLAVNMSATQIRDNFLTDPNRENDTWKNLEISCANSPNDCVVGGPVDVLHELVSVLSGHPWNKKCVKLDVPVAYHTTALKPILAKLEELARQIQLSPPLIPITSNVLGRVVEPGEEDVFTPAYFSQHCCNTVLFTDGVADLISGNDKQKQSSSEAHHWIEIGPRPVLLPMIRPHLLNNTSNTLMPIMKKACHPSQTLAELLSCLYQNGVNVKWRLAFENLSPTPKLIDLPCAPLLRTEFLIPLPEEKPPQGLQHDDVEQNTGWKTTEFAAVHRQLEDSLLEDHGKDTLAVFETPVRDLAGLIEGHVICGHMLCPASVYEEMALAASMQRADWSADRHAIKLSDISFPRPLVASEKEENRAFRIVLRSNERNSEHKRFEISTACQDESHKTHCTGLIAVQENGGRKLLSKLNSTKQMVSRRKTALANDTNAQIFSRSVIYDQLFSRVVNYSSKYHTVKRMFLSEACEETYAICELDSITQNGPERYASQPVMLDTLLHIAGFAANLSVAADDCFICHSVGSLRLYKPRPKDNKFEVYCSNFSSGQEHGNREFTADAYAIDEEGVVAVSKGMRFALTTLTKMKRALDISSGSMQSRKPSIGKSELPQDERSPSRTPTAVIEDHDEGHTSDNTSDQSEGSDSGSGSYSTGVTTPIASGDTKTALATAISETTGVPVQKLDAGTSLAAIGVDSLMLLELEKKLERTFHTDVHTAQLSSCRTIEDVGHLIFGAGRDSDTAKNSPCLPTSIDFSKAVLDAKRRTISEEMDTEPMLSPEDMKILQSRLTNTGEPETIQMPTNSPTPNTRELAPLYLVHPGAGMCYEYRQLGSLSGRAVFALHDPRIFAQNREEDWSSIEEMAEDYVDRVIQHLRERFIHCKDVLLGGYSFGGVVAFAMARIMQQRSNSPISVRGVVLIDSPPPVNHEPLAWRTIEAAMAKKHTQHPTTRPKHIADFGQAIANLAVRNNLRRGRMISQYHPLEDREMMAADLKVVLLRSYEGFPRNAQTMPENEWLHGMHNREETGVEGWREVMRRTSRGGNVEVRMIPGDHFGPFESKNIDDTTEELKSACNLLNS